jgi:WD40 repeat protein
MAGSFFLKPSSRVPVVAYSPDGEHIITAGTTDNNITLWNSQTNKDDAVLSGHTGPVSCLVYSPCGKLLISTSRDKTARLWDTSSLTGIKTGFILASTQTSEIQAAAFSPLGTHFVTAGIDDAVQLWDVATREVLATLQGCGNSNFTVAFSPNGDHIAIGGLDESLYLWDGKSTTPGDKLCGHSGRINCVAYSADGQWIATGCADKTVRLWRCKTSITSSHGKWTCVSVVRDFMGPIQSIAWSPTSTFEFVTGCDDHSVRVWQLEESEGGIHVRLEWGSNIEQLVALDLTAKDVTGLSDINRNLLEQRGAIVS